MSFMGEGADILSAAVDGVNPVVPFCMASEDGVEAEVMLAVSNGLSWIMVASPARPSRGLPFPS